jgi:hypothetical protein
VDRPIGDKLPSLGHPLGYETKVPADLLGHLLGGWSTSRPESKTVLFRSSMSAFYMAPLPKDGKYLPISCEPPWIKAIIFGRCTPARVKTYSREQPFTTELRQSK